MHGDHRDEDDLELDVHVILVFIDEKDTRFSVMAAAVPVLLGAMPGSAGGVYKVPVSLRV